MAKPLFPQKQSGDSAPQKKSRPAPKNTPWRWNHWHLSIYAVMLCGVLSIAIAAILSLVIALNIPSIKTLASYQPAATSVIYDNQRQVIGRAYRENRILINLDLMPKLLTKAFVSAEDARFYQHPGVDAWSILRALVHNIKKGSRGQGGSTITQQVARSLLLTPEKTYIRKLKEAILAYRIDKALTKDEIMHIYLNQIYLGETAYGVGAAAQTYFGKEATDLNLAEIAILAGLPQAPSRYSPFKHFKKAKRRQAYVLNRMAEDGYITPTQARKAYEQNLFWSAQHESTKESGYFVQDVKNYIRNKYSNTLLNEGGLQIYTTLDSPLQRAADKAVRQGLAQWGIREQESSHPQAALVCLEVATGRILAMTGGVNFESSQFNRASQARRQPGSAFKPIIYAAALTKGFTPNSMIDDAPVEFSDANGKNTWKPQNFSGEFYGPTTLRNGLVYSRNIVTIKLLQAVGIPTAIKTATEMGIQSPLSKNLALALGSSEISLLELTGAYTVFASGGLYRPPSFIIKIVDRNGKLLESSNLEPKRVLSEAVAFQITHILKGVIDEGTGRNARGIAYAAGKTGTTDANMDAWFIGYTPTLTTGVWMGHDQNKTLGEHETGGRAAAPIWLSFMQKTTQYQSGRDFPIPEGITFIPIDHDTGDFQYLDTENALWEAFQKDNLPSWQNREPQTPTPAAEKPQEPEGAGSFLNFRHPQ